MTWNPLKGEPTNFSKYFTDVKAKPSISRHLPRNRPQRFGLVMEYEILDATSRGNIGKTRLLNRIETSYETAQKYITSMTDKELIKKNEDNTYSITDKGRTLKDMLQRVKTIKDTH
jgi:predicted transcriptional regulator